jgi:hypothetical protein
MARCDALCRIDKLHIARDSICMMIASRKTLFYSDSLLIRIDPGLRAALAAAAQRERLPMSEMVRRAIRSAITDSALAMQSGGAEHAQSAH